MGPDAMRLGEREEYMSGIIDDSVAALFRLQRCRRWRGVARLEPFDAEGNDIDRVDQPGLRAADRALRNPWCGRDSRGRSVRPRRGRRARHIRRGCRSNPSRTW